MVGKMSAFTDVVIPIDDVNDKKEYSEEEKLVRCKLASLYRLVDLMGWSQEIFTSISVSTCRCSLLFY